MDVQNEAEWIRHSLTYAVLARFLCGDPAARHPTVHHLWIEVDPILKDAVRPTASGELPPDVDVPAPRPSTIGRDKHPSIASLPSDRCSIYMYGVAADARTGAVWAVGADARLLERRDDSWVRVPLEASVTGRVLNVHLRAPRVIVLVEDGSAFAHDTLL